MHKYFLSNFKVNILLNPTILLFLLEHYES